MSIVQKHLIYLLLRYCIIHIIFFMFCSFWWQDITWFYSYLFSVYFSYYQVDFAYTIWLQFGIILNCLLVHINHLRKTKSENYILIRLLHNECTCFPAIYLYMQSYLLLLQLSTETHLHLLFSTGTLLASYIQSEKIKHRPKHDKLKVFIPERMREFVVFVRKNVYTYVFLFFYL